jgi:L-rhamnose isomerase
MPDSSDEGGERHLPRWNKLDTLEDARRRQMRAVRTAERIMYDAYERGDTETALKAATRVTQGVRCYVKVVEASEFEARIQALERRAFGGAGGDGRADGRPEIAE